MSTDLDLSSEQAPARYEGFEAMPIAGRWREGSSDARAIDTDPFSGQTLTEIALAGVCDLDEAYEAAREAQRDWAARGPGERAEVLRRAADILQARKMRSSNGWYERPVAHWAGASWSGVHDEEHALALANDTEYGLSSAVFTSDEERGTSFALRLQAGMTHINESPVNDDPNTAFGGENASGIGRFGGDWALEEFTTDHWISIQHSPREYPIS